MDIHFNIYFTVPHEMAVDKIFAREFTLVPFHPNAIDEDDAAFKAIVSALEEYKLAHCTRIKTHRDSSSTVLNVSPSLLPLLSLIVVFTRN